MTAPAERDVRISQVVTWLIEGKTRTEILRKSAELWGVADRTVNDYLTEAREKLAESSKFRFSEQVGIAVERLNMLFEKSVEIQDFRGAAAIQKQLNELLGLTTKG